MAIAEITATFASLKTALDIGKAITAAGNAVEVATLRLQLADLMGALADAKISMIGVMEQVEVREKEIARLNDALANKAKVERRNGAYYELDSEGKPSGDPYCMNCWERSHELAHLSVPRFANEECVCPRCKSKFDYRRSGPIRTEPTPPPAPNPEK